MSQQSSAPLKLHWWKIWKVYPCVNMQILFMHSLQKLRQETLQTFGATLICSALDLRRKERKAKNCHVLSSAWAYVWMTGFQENLYTSLCVFTFAERSPSPKRKVFNFHPKYWTTRHHKLTVYVTKGRIIRKSVLFSTFIFFTGI